MNTIVFVQVHGKDGLVEAELPEGLTFEQMRSVLDDLGIELDKDTFVFLDDDEEPLEGKRKEPLPPIARGARIHVSKCRRIKVTVHFLHMTEERAFSPGTRVKKVKAWAVEKFKLDGNGAAEH